MIWVIKITFALMFSFIFYLSSLVSVLFAKINGNNKDYEKFADNHYDEEWNISQDEIEEIKDELKDEIRDELYDDLYDEVYEKVINDIENEKN